MTEWRPNVWKNPYPIPEPRVYDRALTEEEIGKVYRLERDILTQHEAFEAGADAMLDTLRKHGIRVNNVSWEHKGKGVIIFIPDNES